MTIFATIIALTLIVAAFIWGEKRGDETGYERGTFDGRQQARNEAAISAADVARRQREATERARNDGAVPAVLREGVIKQNVNEMPAGPRPEAPRSQVAPHHNGKRPKPRR